MLFYYSASIAVETWAKTSSTGSSESTWAEQDGTTCENLTHTILCMIFDFCFFYHSTSYTHLPDNASALIKGNDWLGCFVIQVQALLDGLLVVIRTAAGLATLQKPLDHGLFFCIDVQQQAGFANLEPKTV